MVRNITRATAIPAVAACNLFRGGGAVLRAITVIAWAPLARIVRRIAMSSAAGVMSRQPGILRTLHAGAARPQP